jgi:Subtilase family/Repeat of unknown function (DUF5648)
VAERRASQPRRSRTARGQQAQFSGVVSERELIVVAASPEAPLAAVSRAAADMPSEVAPLSRVLRGSGASLQPLFRAQSRVAQSLGPSAHAGAPSHELAVFHRVQAPERGLDELAEQLRSLDVIEAAYVKPPAALPQINDMTPSDEPLPPLTADFSARQLYLQAAPAGVNAVHAWTFPGGRGQNVGVIDIEGAWRFSHEDLQQNQGGVIGGTPSSDLGWRNHGTAVIGVIGGDDNGLGITGIAPDANVRAISIFGALGSAAAIRQAADRLNPGDVILIELHRPGPRFGFQLRNDQRGFIAVEWWPDDLAAIQYATSRGVIVVEAAGNGAENLDDAIYDTPDTGFPASWTNPFNRSNRDSGAIIVGAGAPPPGTHNRNHGPDRSRLDFSNYGAMVDVQGWGREVTTCGYGDIQGGNDEDLWYTDTFSGTSSSSPVVVGSLACIEGVLRAHGQTPLTPPQARDLLRATGSPQQDAPGRPATQRIGNRPDLQQAIESLNLPTVAVPLHRYMSSGATDHFYTTDWNELGNGNLGYVYEGVACYAFATQRPGTVPLYRYVSYPWGDHFYTTDWNELGQGAWGWDFETVQCYVLPNPQPGAVPLYRYWNATIGDHFYTTNWGELGAGKFGWQFEWIQCYVYLTPVTVPGAPEAVAAGPGAAMSPAPDTFTVRVPSPVSAIAAVPGAPGQDTFYWNVEPPSFRGPGTGQDRISVTINVDTSGGRAPSG